MEWMILPLKRYADFEGRSRRLEFWLFQLLNTLVAAVLVGPFFLTVISTAAASSLDPTNETAVEQALLNGGVGLSAIGLGLFGLYTLAVLVPSIAVTVRRLHDRDMSGWWYLGLIVASLIPLVGLLASIAMFVLMVLPGTAGPNRFGSDPKNPHQADVFA